MLNFQFLSVCFQAMMNELQKTSLFFIRIFQSYHILTPRLVELPMAHSNVSHLFSSMHETYPSKGRA